METKDLKITTIQTSLEWENVEANLANFARHLQKIANATDLIILPEMFNTGFTMNTTGVYEEMDGRTVSWLKQKAVEKGCVITGSLIVKDRGNYYNRLVWMKPDGTYEYYDKRHLFRMADEDRHFDYGKKRLIVELNGWRICPLVCYDLRFPVWSRNSDLSSNSSGKMGNEPVYDLLIYIANWPEPRSSAWSSLLPARAIENQVYVAGLNRIGQDGKGISYSGDTAVIDPYGRKISTTQDHQESIETLSLSMQLLVEFRKKFPVAMDADHFNIELND